MTVPHVRVDMNMKQCLKCEKEFPANLTYFKKNCKIYLSSRCRTCLNKEQQNKRKNSNYNEKRNAYLKENKDKLKVWTKTYKDKNKQKVKENNSRYHKERYNSDTLFRLNKCLRSRLNKALKGNYKTGSAVSDLGCSIDELKRHLESQFEPWMNWDNWGPYDANRETWQIDHILALDSFNLNISTELKKACHYSNLRPLKAIDNLIKNKF